MDFPNRFKGLRYVKVNSLRTSFIAGCLFNLFVCFAVSVLAVLVVYVLGSASPVSSVPSVVTLAPFTVTPLPTLTALPTSTPFPTSTPYPTSTNIPTSTPFPTSTPYPTSTPFTLTIVMSLPTPTPTPLYTYDDLQSGLVRASVVSTYAFGFYNAYCVVGVSRVEPRVIGVPDTVSGLHWRIWNDYSPAPWSADTSTYDCSFNCSDTFFLSSDASIFNLALFFYDEQVSDLVLVDYPGTCTSVQILFLKAVSPLAYNVAASYSSVFSVSTSVTVSNLSAISNTLIVP